MTGHAPVHSEPDSWQRLSPWALAFLVGHRLQALVRENLYLLLGAGAGSVFLEWLGPRELLIGLGAIFAAAVVHAAIHHRRFRFRLEDDALRVRSGLVEQKELRIPFARVMNVDLAQPLYLRPFGLVKLSLETPGARQKEVELPGISRDLAEAMRERIAAVRAEHPAIEVDERSAQEGQASPIHRARTGDLLLHGVASNQVWILAGALFSLLGLMETRIWRLVAEEPIGEALRAWLGNGAAAVALAFLMVFLLLLVASMLIARVRFHDFTLWQIDDRFRTRCGLLETRERTVPRHKLLGLTLVQTGIGRLLGRWYLIGRQAGLVSPQEQERAGHFMVPGLDQAERDRVVASLIPRAGDRPALEGIDPSYRSVLWSRWLVVFLALAAISLGLGPEGTEGGARAALLVIPVALAAIHLRWRHWGWGQAFGLLWIRRGLLGQRLEVFAMASAQRVEVRQSPVQRRRGVANLVLTLPYGPLVLPYLPLATSIALADRVLWQVETSSSHRL